MNFSSEDRTAARIAQKLRDAEFGCEILNLAPTQTAVLRRDRIVVALALTNRVSGAARIAMRASDQNGGIGSSARLEPVGFFVTGLDAMGLIGWRRKRKAQAV